MAAPIPVKTSAFFSLQKNLVSCLKHNNLYSGLLTPSSRCCSPITTSWKVTFTCEINNIYHILSNSLGMFCTICSYKCVRILLLDNAAGPTRYWVVGAPLSNCSIHAYLHEQRMKCPHSEFARIGIFFLNFSVGSRSSQRALFFGGQMTSQQLVYMLGQTCVQHLGLEFTKPLNQTS
jgi:hypothetical protein